MSAPSIQLTTVQGGINRLRTKGGANQHALYDLLNAYVTSQRTVKVRPGTFRATSLNTNTKGLVAYQGVFHTFSHISVAVPAGYLLHVLTHPLAHSGDTPAPIKSIHFCAPFMGFLYVVAEFMPINSDIIAAGLVWHYWLRGQGAVAANNNVWGPSKVYKIGDVVAPNVPNGLSYQARRLSTPNPGWSPGTVHVLNDKVEPRSPNGYFYKVIEADGQNPASGTTEPAWPATEGSTVVEETNIGDPSGDAASASATQPAGPNNTQSQTTIAGKPAQPVPIGAPPGVLPGAVFGAFGPFGSGAWKNPDGTIIYG